MTSFNETSSHDSGNWKKDKSLELKPELLKFTTDETLRNKALGFAELLLRDSGVKKNANDMESKPTAEKDSRLDTTGYSEGSSEALQDDTLNRTDHEKPKPPNTGQEKIETEPELLSDSSEDNEATVSREGDFGNGQYQNKDLESNKQPNITQDEFDEATQSAQESGYKAGFTDGEKKGREEGIADAEKKLREPLILAQEELNKFMTSLKEAVSDRDNFFLPLKRLSVHLAQEIARVQLSISDDGISQLILRCLDELGAKEDEKIRVQLSPDDMVKIKKLSIADSLIMANLEEDHTLTQGSVRVSMGSSVVEDLIENRIQKLSQNIFGDQNNGCKQQIKPTQIQEKKSENLSSEITGTEEPMPSISNQGDDLETAIDDNLMVKMSGENSDQKLESLPPETEQPDQSQAIKVDVPNKEQSNPVEELSDPDGTISVNTPDIDSSYDPTRDNLGKTTDELLDLTEGSEGLSKKPDKG